MCEHTSEGPVLSLFPFQPLNRFVGGSAAGFYSSAVLKLSEETRLLFTAFMFFKQNAFPMVSVYELLLQHFITPHAAW